MIDLKSAIKAASTTQKQWALSQGTTQKTVIDLIKSGCVVDDEGRVLRPTRYTVKTESEK